MERKAISWATLKAGKAEQRNGRKKPKPQKTESLVGVTAENPPNPYKKESWIGRKSPEILKDRTITIKCAILGRSWGK